MKVFLSYSHQNFKIADKIDSNLQSVGLTVVRDIRDLSPYNSLKNFMIKSVNISDKSILLISDAYLKSKNCMFEILEVIRRRDYNQRMIPIVLKCASKLFSPEERISYVKYWAEKEETLKKELETIGWHENVEIVKDLAIYSDIKRSIGNFCSHISDILSVSIEDLEKSNFTPLLDSLGYDITAGAAEMIEIINHSDIEEREVQAEIFYEKYNQSKYTDYLKGYLADERKLYKKAKTHYQLCIEKDQDFVPAKINLGNLYMVVFDDYKSAESQYRRALTKEPSTKAYNNLGILYHYYLNQPAKAEECYKKVLSIDPYYRHSYFNLGNLFRVVTKDVEKAESYYRKAIEIDKNYGRAFNGLGIIYLSEKRDLNYALYCFKKALESDPNKLEFILNISEYYRSRGNNTDKALFYYEHALLLYPSSTVLIKQYLSLLEEKYPEEYKIQKNKYDSSEQRKSEYDLDLEEVVFFMGVPVIEQMHSSKQRIIDYYNKR